MFYLSLLVVLSIFFVFFKQKPAYEVRFSDWSSDVCASDLRAGVLLTYGIPGFKLEKPVVMRRIERLVEAGIHFHLGFEVGKDASLDALRQRHDAMLIATGVYKAREIAVPGNEADGVRSEEHTSELQSLMRISYAVFCLK